ncbi:MAG: molybdate ABC transporter substrate-binding protein, partial [Dolichospermum sp.]
MSKKTKLIVLLATALSTLLLTIGLPSVISHPVVAQSHPKLLVSAAASLKEVLEEIKPLYQQSKG